MSKKIFSNEDIKILKNNKYASNVSDKAITYTNEFKIHFIAEYSKGKSARIIFKEAGFNINITGIKRVECFSARYRKSYKDNGVIVWMIQEEIIVVVHERKI